MHNKAIYGRISMLNKIRPASSPTDHLFVGTERYAYFTLSWDPHTQKLKTELSYVDVSEKSARDAQSGDRCNKDPTDSFLTIEMLEGVITVIPIAKLKRKPTDPEPGTLQDAMPLRIEEMFVRSSTFFHSRNNKEVTKPRLALLHKDASEVVRLKTREIDHSAGLDGPIIELVPITDQADETLEQSASHLIPVPAPAGGILVLGETTIEYFEQSSKQRKWQALPESTIFVAWEQIDSQRFILADEFGKLYLLMLDLTAHNSVAGWKLDLLGETSRASVLLYLGNGQVFVGSHQGDSQVIAIRPQRLEVLQTLPNVAPILDFAIMDMGNRSGDSSQANEYSSGQARLVTGSGAFKDGSLRSIRSGVGLEDLGQLGEMENITDIFALRSRAPYQRDDTLVVSFVDETRVFYFSEDGDVEELETSCGLTLHETTLFATTTTQGYLLQANPSFVRLVDPKRGVVIAESKPGTGKSITLASANSSTLLISTGGSDLVALDIIKGLTARSKRTFDQESQIACINVSPSSERFGTIGFFQSSAISVLDLTNLKTVQSEDAAIDSVSIPRSLLLAQVLKGRRPTLFAAMADGNVVTYDFDPTSGSLSNKKSTVLGKQQATLRALPRADGVESVFATCEHTSLIYDSEGRITFSALTAEDATSVCPFDTVAYPYAVAIASSKDLRIGRVDEERSTHVQGLAVGETVRRIAYSSELKAFGLGTIRRSLEDGTEIVQSHFKLADEIGFGIEATFALNADELVECAIRAQLPDGAGGSAERFIIGTAYLDEDDSESVRGRIVVLEVTEDRQLKTVAEHSVKGACRCLRMLDGKIVAALIKTVVVYSLEHDTGAAPFFKKCASYRVSTAPIDLHVDASTSTIIIADLMKAVSVVKFAAGLSGNHDTLIEIARYYQTSWSTAVAQVNNASIPNEKTPTYLLSDAEGNLLVLQQNITAATAEDGRRLNVVSEMCLGEMVNRIRTVSVPASPAAASAVITPRAFLATVEGAIYLYGSIRQDKVSLMINLQDELAKLVQSPGGVPFQAFRAVRTTIREGEGPVRFVDGELVEQFLGLDEETQRHVARGLNADAEELRVLVEGLRRLR